MAASGSKSMTSLYQMGGLQARANLNGGELDEGLILPDREKAAVS